jgi:tripartite-type tricarboxylate transporter receptor subunit TctC
MRPLREHRPIKRRNARRGCGLLIALTVLASLAPTSSRAQGADWPSRTVTVIVGISAGGSTDLMARIATKKISEDINQTFVVENRVGGGGIVAATHVARAAPDGYTVLFAASPHMAVVPRIQTVSYDPVADFAPVSAFSTGPFILTVRSSLPVKTVAEFIAYAKANKLNYGSSGIGSVSHLSSELFFSRAGIEATHVPFRGGDQVMAALLGGQIDIYFSPAANVMPYANADQLKILMVATEQRMKPLPHVPTIGEFYPDSVLTSWNGFFVPAKTPKPIVDKLARHIAAAAKDPDIVAHLTKLGIEPNGTSPEEFAALIKRQQPLFDAAITTAKLKKE